MTRAAVTGIALAVLASPSFALPAQAETNACTIVTAFPSSLSSPGVFRRGKDIQGCMLATHSERWR